MFNNRKAWFSTSVEKTICDIWVRERGMLGNPNDSEYLFSANAQSSDTVRIFNSEKYLNGEVTVFHASFVAACVRSQNTTIGQYVLPPAELHEAIQERIGPFIWANSKAMQHIKDVNQQGLKTSRQGIKRRLRATNTTRPDANRRTSFEDSGIHMTLQENNVNENEICSAERNGDDFEPVPVNSCCQIKQHNHQVNNFLTSWEGRRAEGRERAGFLAAFTWLDDRTFPEHQVPKNGQGQLNPEEARRAHIHVSKMQKYSGPLSDFSPGHAGYRVLREMD